jgi:hypothetical protein
MCWLSCHRRYIDRQTYFALRRPVNKIRKAAKGLTHNFKKFSSSFLPCSDITDSGWN